MTATPVNTPNRSWLWTSVFCVIALQLLISLPRINLPFLDGRLHWYYDNAKFLNHAVHSNASEKWELKQWAGTSTLKYDENNNVTHRSNYPNHGLLNPAVFRLFTKLFGYGDFVPRLYSLMLTISSSLFLLFLLRRLLKQEALSLALVLLYNLLPLRFLYMDQFKYEGAVELVCISALFFMVSYSDNKFRRWGFWVSAALLFHTSYYAYFFAASMIIYLFLQDTNIRENQRLKEALIACSAGFVSTFTIQYNLGFDWEQIQKMFLFRTGTSIPWTNWAPRQIAFMLSNFSPFHFVICACLLLLVPFKNKWWRSPISYFGVALVLQTLLYITIFRNQSDIHHFIQWLMLLGYILLIASAAPILAAFIEKSKPMVAVSFSVILLVTSTYSYIGYVGTVRSSFGTAEDIEILLNMERRVLYLENGISGPPGWWSGPSANLYMDPTYRKNKDVSLKKLSQVKRLDPSRDVIVVRRTEQAMRALQQSVGNYGVKSMQLFRLSPNFAFFSVTL